MTNATTLYDVSTLDIGLKKLVDVLWSAPGGRKRLSKMIYDKHGYRGACGFDACDYSGEFEGKCALTGEYTACVVVSFFHE